MSRGSLPRLPRFVSRYGPWAVVTGASSGIGTEFARQLAAQGLSLVLVARRRERLEELARELMAEHGVDTLAVPLDLAREDFLDDLLPHLEDKEVGLLVNNAGFAVAGPLTGNDLGRELDSLYVNCRAPLILTHSLVPAMVERGGGGVILVSSVVGHIPLPYLSNYSATKAYDRFLGEGLWFELGQHGVDVLTLCPGATRTEFGEVAGFGPSGGMEVGPVVARALRGLGREPTVVPGSGNYLLALASRLLPTRVRLWLAGRQGRSLEP